MGFFPKRVKRGRHQKRMVLIAKAALAGATFHKHYDSDGTYAWTAVTYRRGFQQSTWPYESKFTVAEAFLDEAF
jgi:hypothetical protein